MALTYHLTLTDVFWGLHTCFIQNFSGLAAPLTALTSTLVQFIWSPLAEMVFQELKWWFTSAPILIQPDTDCHFIVEVDASDVEVGAIPSQYSMKD